MENNRECVGQLERKSASLTASNVLVDTPRGFVVTPLAYNRDEAHRRMAEEQLWRAAL